MCRGDLQKICTSSPSLLADHSGYGCGNESWKIMCILTNIVGTKGWSNRYTSGDNRYNSRYSKCNKGATVDVIVGVIRKSCIRVCIISI